MADHSYSGQISPGSESRGKESEFGVKKGAWITKPLISIFPKKKLLIFKGLLNCDGFCWIVKCVGFTLSNPVRF